MQTVSEWSVALGVISEPYKVPKHPRWFGDAANEVAIYWGGARGDPPCRQVDSDSGIVVVEWGSIIVCGCYVSPNCSLSAYETYLGKLEVFVRKYFSRPILVLGDLNARSRVWGDVQDSVRGETLLEWAAALDLRLLNQGSVSTCVRWQGESIVDLSWASQSAERLVSEWRVAEEVVTLSDHRFIVFNVLHSRPDGTNRRRFGASLGWALKRLDKDLLIAAAHSAAWVPPPEWDDPSIPESESLWFRDTMTSICDAAMPRVKRNLKFPVYWWSEHIAQLREVCLSSRRLFTRTRRRRRATEDEKTRAYAAYRAATVALQTAIADAKSKSWDELLDGLNRDPWGRPYKMVLGKLRPWVPPLTETLEENFTRSVVDVLFPQVSSAPQISADVSWSSDLEVSDAELVYAVRRLSARNTAPGPDGIPGRALVIALAELGERIKRLFNSCFRHGKFPAIWKEAKLVLLRKDGRPLNSPSGFRPICLLEEAGKLLERIIALRLNRHLLNHGPDLSVNQFGFRQGHSTVDAILRVKELTEEAVLQGKVVLAVSLDIVNAFNSLPWKAIFEAMVYHDIPAYLRNLISNYLSERTICYQGPDGATVQRSVVCGVPQGSVLGPLLWNLAYDAVLRTELPHGVNVVCYADDTLILAEGESFQRATRLAELGISRVVGRICGLGLKVAPQKTEALWFHGLPRRETPPASMVRVGDAEVQVGQCLKYLGLYLDGRWTFEEHLERLVPRIEKVAGAMQRLLPNLGGPNEGVRRLYAGVVRSIALYGAPVWSDKLSSVRRRSAKLNAAQRRIAIRVARGYRTISFDAATVLARQPPFDILAEMDAKVYHTLRQRNGAVADQELATLRERAHKEAIMKWYGRLNEPQSTRQRVVAAILPSFDAWLKREGRVTFHLTQVLTGHGCFGEYLNRIGREQTPQCHHCGFGLDSAQHTLESCPSWHSERQALVQTIGSDLSLPAVIAAMLDRRDAWNAVVTFCETVMVQKETSERDRERADPARRRRRRALTSRVAHVRRSPV